MNLARYRPKEKIGWIRDRNGRRIPVKVTVDDSGTTQQVEFGDRLDATVRTRTIRAHIMGRSREVAQETDPVNTDPEEPLRLWTPLEGTIND